MHTESIEKEITFAKDDVREWVKVAAVDEFPHNGGTTFLHKDKQIAIYNFAARGEWYATQNMCPHRMEMVLSRGIIGDAAGEPKVSCPFHKKNFSLKSGECMSGDDYKIAVYPVKVENDFVYVGVPYN